MPNNDIAAIAARYARLESERLLLRAFTEDDLDDLAALYADPVVMRYYPKTYTRQETQGMLSKILNGYSQVGYHLLATIYKPDGRFIGRCGIVQQTIEGESLPEIGYMLDKDYWGLGLATEAACCAISASPLANSSALFRWFAQSICHHRQWQRGTACKLQRTLFMLSLIIIFFP